MARSSAARVRAVGGTAAREVRVQLVRARCVSAEQALGSAAALAEWLGVDRSRVTRWKAGELPDPAREEQLVGLDAVVSLLRGYLEEEAIPDWLLGVNAQLGDRRPVDVLRDGRLSEVVAAIEAEKSGAYA
jgi:hypothetical protein